MSKVNISELLKMQPLYSSVVVAGKDSLNTEFSWCTPDIAVDVNEKVWMLPNLLVVYIGRPDGVTWEEYFSRLLYQHAAGVFFVGSDFKQFGLTDEATAFCDEHSLPVIWVPKNIPVTMFLSKIYPFLLGTEVETYSKARWVKEICLSDEIPSDLFIANYGYNRNYIYCSMIVRVWKLGSTDILRKERCLTAAYETVLAEHSLDEAKVLIYADADSLLCFIPFPPGSSKAAIKERIRATAHDMKQICKDKCKCRISVGTSAFSIKELHESYEHASKTEQLVKRLHVHEPVSFYDDWHMHLMLVDRPDAELREFMNQTLRPIIDDPILMDTLTMYLICGENLRATAARLYVHVSTLRYRIGKVSDLLSCDFEDTTTRFRLRMAITIYRYLQGEGKDEE